MGSHAIIIFLKECQAGQRFASSMPGIDIPLPMTRLKRAGSEYSPAKITNVGLGAVHTRSRVERRCGCTTRYTFAY